MASTIIPEADQRIELSTLRIAMLVIATLTPCLLYQKDSVQAGVLLEERFPVVSGLYGLTAITSYSFCYKLETDRVDILENQVEKEKTSYNV